MKGIGVNIACMGKQVDPLIGRKVLKDLVSILGDIATVTGNNDGINRDISYFLLYFQQGRMVSALYFIAQNVG